MPYRIRGFCLMLARFGGALLTLTLSFRLGAQGVIEGRVYDDVRGRVPAAGGVVWLLGTERYALVDSSGRFTFSDLSLGRYTVAHAGAWLDSLGLPPISQTIELTPENSRKVVELRSPSRASYQVALCGSSLDEDASALIGELRFKDGLHAASAQVIAIWSELVANASGIVRRTMRAEATADLVGAYRLCGVPIGTTVAIWAAPADTSLPRWQTDTLWLQLEPGAHRIDLVLGPQTPLVTLSGRVVGADAAPVAAELSAGARADLVTRTDSLGAFILSVPPRSVLLSVRAPGFEPLYRLIDPVFGPADDISLTLVPLGTNLDPIVVVESVLTSTRREFDERRQFHHQGAFLDDSTLARYPVKSSRVLQVHVPRSQVDRRGKFYLAFGSVPCEPRLFVDGTDMRVPDGIELQYWLERAKRIEVYRDAFSPPRFSDPAGCGSVVIWTH